MQTLHVVNSSETSVGGLPVGTVVTFVGYGKEGYDRIIIVEPKAHGYQLGINQETGNNHHIYPGSVKPFSRRMGIGFYFPRNGNEVVSEGEVMLASAKGRQYREQENQKAEAKRQEAERKREASKKLFSSILPPSAKALIIAQYMVDDRSDISTDLYMPSTAYESLLLGFSSHERDLFSEMRKFAGNTEQTAHLAEKNEEFENRGRGSYQLGESTRNGWIIRKVRIGNPETFEFPEINQESQLRLGKTTAAEKPVKENILIEIPEGLQLLEYTEKSVALFGNTKPIKDHLKDLGGSFNFHLVHPITRQKACGWVFSKKRADLLNDFLNKRFAEKS